MRDGLRVVDTLGEGFVDFALWMKEIVVWIDEEKCCGWRCHFAIAELCDKEKLQE